MALEFVLNMLENVCLVLGEEKGPKMSKGNNLT